MSLAVLLIPLVAALVVALTRQRRLAGAIAVVASGVTFMAALALGGDAGVRMAWLPGLGIDFYLRPDGADAVLVAVAALVMIPTLAWAAIKVERGASAFLALLLAMQAGLNGIFLAKDLVLFYLFWEATLVPSLFLLGVWGRARRREAAMKFLLYAVAGSFLMLVAILAVRPLSGALSYGLEDLLTATRTLTPATQTWLFVAFALAFAVKLPLWPLHAWLVDFHEENHASGAADVAGTLYKVGGWGFFAWALPLFPEGARALAPPLLFLAAFTAVYAAVIAAQQRDLKRLLAYASLSHMGIVGTGLFGLHLAGLSGAVMLLAAQMLSTGGMFLISGMLYERRGSFDLEQYGGLAKAAPALAGVSLFVLFAAIGVPGLSNFPGEFMSLLGAYQTSPWLAALATLGVIAAGVYGVNLYQRLYWGEAENGPARELGRAEALILAPIIAGILFFGLLPNAPMSRIDVQAQVIEGQLRVGTTPDPALARGER
ncbi:MAG: NADH-quinone oxidoreductase subunit M [Deinococcota bacterium]|nr:NADH-quinone oxidoreductase subunit M [Deinococcota bacterium]